MKTHLAHCTQHLKYIESLPSYIHVSGDHHHYRIRSLPLALTSPITKATLSTFQLTFFVLRHHSFTLSPITIRKQPGAPILSILSDSLSQTKISTSRGKHASPASTTYRPSGFRTPRFKSPPKQRGHTKTQRHPCTSG